MKMMMKIGAMGTALMLALPVSGQSTATVTWHLKTVAGTSQNRALTITPLAVPEECWTNIFWDVGWTIQPTNGVAMEVLEPNDYLVTMQGVAGDMTITVPTNGGNYNALSLTTDVSDYMASTNGPATVLFSLRKFTGGAQNRALRITPIYPALPMQNGSNIVWGAPLSVTPTNGLARVVLEPGGYSVDASASGMPGTMTIYVPTDGGTYSAATLPNAKPVSLIMAGTHYDELVAPVAGQSAATVTWYLKTVAGTSQNRALTITPLVVQEEYWTNIFWDAGWTIQPTNGVAMEVLEPNDYLVTMQGVAGDMTITVPTNGGNYNALSLTTDVSDYMAGTNGPATVLFSLRKFTGGAQNRALRITPIYPALPMQNGSNIVWGAPLSVTPTNGLARGVLEPGGYSVDASASGMPGTMTIYVPPDGGTYSAATLPSAKPVSLISAGTYYDNPPGGGGYRSYVVSGITNGQNYWLSLGNAISLVRTVGFDSTEITTNGVFTAGDGIWHLKGPADWSPMGPYQAIIITALIFTQ